MNKRFDITALGEILADMIPAGKDEAGDIRYTRKAGGAPLNLLAAAAARGARTAFIGKVGKDTFGDYLRAAVKSAGVCDEWLLTDAAHDTTLAFVTLDEKGERDFSFYRRYGADVFLTREEVPDALLRQTRVFHFGSLSMTAEPARSATEYAVRAARAAGAVISYDPNYRPPLWNGEEEARERMAAPLSLVDIAKMSREELLFLFGGDVKDAVGEVFSRGVKLLLLTDGATGASLYFAAGGSISLPAAHVTPVDTTGAGDIFFGTFLAEWLRGGARLTSLSREEGEKYLAAAIRIAGRSTEKKGAIPSIPREAVTPLPRSFARATPRG